MGDVYSDTLRVLATDKLLSPAPSVHFYRNSSLPDKKIRNYNLPNEFR